VSFWEINREILRQKYPGLLEEITSHTDTLAPEDIKIETAATGDPSLCVKGFHVHSPRDPAREGQRLAQTVSAGNGSVVVLGFGLGYAAQFAVEFGRPVIIVEKYKNLLIKALELRDLSGFLSKKNIIFVVGGTGDGILNALGIANEIISPEKTGKKNEPSVIRNKALVDLEKEWYGAVEGKIRTWTMRDDVNTATHRRFGRRWVRNLSRNMSAIRDCPGISHLSGLASCDAFCAASFESGGTSYGSGGAGEFSSENVPVFLAAAGPSLDKTVPLLRDIYRRCIVVAVDTSFRFLVKNGIQPDFVLVVDPQFWNSRHLDRCINEDAPLRTALIAESAVYPPVLRLPFKKIFLCGSLFPLGTFIEKQVDPKGRLGAGGSVATTAWDFARSLGGRDIWISGLDLAFPDLKTHFRGARFEENSNSESVRFNPVETWVVRALRDGIPFKSRSSSGGQVLTDRRLSLYAAWFENQFAMHPEVLNYALFQDGLAITGLQPATAEELLALPDRRDEIDRRIDAAYAQIEIDFHSPQQTRQRAERYENAVSVLTRGLESIRKTAESGEKIAQRALERKLTSAEQGKVLKELDEITRRITESEVKEVAGFLFPKFGDEEETPNEKGDPFHAYLKSSLKLFSGLAKAAEMYT